MVINVVPPLPGAPTYGSLWISKTRADSWLFLREGVFSAMRVVQVLTCVPGVGLVATIMSEDMLHKDWYKSIDRIELPPSNDEAAKLFDRIIQEAAGGVTATALAVEVEAELVSSGAVSKSPLEARAEAAEAEVFRLREELAARRASLAEAAPQRSDRELLRWAVTEALYGVSRVKFRLLRLPAWADLGDDVQGGLFDQISHYDMHRQWEPFPRGDTAAIRADQEILCSLADDLLGRAQHGASGAAFKPRRGWASGVSSQRQEPEEIEHWARIGYAALFVKRRAIETERAAFIRTTHGHGVGAVPAVVNDWVSLDDTEKTKYREMASTVARVASYAQVDAIRRCLMENAIDPVFSGPIVGLIVFGGQTGQIGRIGGSVR